MTARTPMKRVDAVKRLLKRLLHSHHDLCQAQQCVKQILGRNLHAAREPFDRRLLECLNTALIVSYWRPFSNNKGAVDVDPDLPDRFRRILTPAERALHQRLGRARKQDQAHCDPRGRSIRISVSGLGGEAAHRTRPVRTPLSLPEIQQLDEIISKLLAAILEEQSRIVRHLNPGNTF